MAQNKPFKRTYRLFTDGTYGHSGKWMYVRHPHYAQKPDHYIRAFKLIQEDFINLLYYIEPADQNLKCYSFRVYELYIRICTEIEANFQAIFHENGHWEKKNKKGGAIQFNIHDYYLINKSHRLSGYLIELPFWTGDANRMPFLCWKKGYKTPEWWAIYNSLKHNRHENFKSATFRSLINALCALVVVISAQFGTHDLSSNLGLLASRSGKNGFELAIGDYFLIQFPTDWQEDEKYAFDWGILQYKTRPTTNFKY
jgi:hypothetical protein